MGDLWVKTDNNIIRVQKERIKKANENVWLGVVFRQSLWTCSVGLKDNFSESPSKTGSVLPLLGSSVSDFLIADERTGVSAENVVAGTLKAARKGRDC